MNRRSPQTISGRKENIMSLTENGNGMVMPVAPMYGNSGGGFGGFGNFGDGWWLILILLFCGGWGGGFGGGFDGGLYPWMNQAQMTQGGFDQAAIQSSLAGIQTSLTNGFAGQEVASCNRALVDMQTSYTNQIAQMNQNFANQQNLQSQLNGITSQLSNCCCENRASIADLKYTVATENCADRAAISDALRDVIEANTASTQRILDQMCADKIDAKNEKIVELQNQLSMTQLAASQTAQTSAIQAGQRALANEVEQFVAPSPKPCYVVQSPYCCNQGYYGCNG